MRYSRFTTMALMLSLLAVTTLLTGCSAQSGSGPGAQSRPAVQESGAAVISAGTTWDTAAEPPPNKIGGIPAADLTDEPKYGGRLLHGHTGSARLDPHFSVSISTERWPARMLFDGLLAWDLKCNCPAPELAESWKQVDDVTFDFKIRKGVKFHKLPPVNGRELTIEDVKWSMDRLAGLGARPLGVVSINYERFATVKEFKILDDTTLRMVLKQPDSMILREIIYDFGVVVPKEAAVDGMFMVSKALIGTGPFIGELVQNTGQSRYKKNPDYWKKDAKGRQLPYLDEVWTLGGGGAATIQAALKTAQIHRAGLGYAYGKVFENDPQYRIYNTFGSGVGTSGFQMNVKLKPFDDVRVRRAINLGVDREELGLTVYGPGGYYNWGFLGTWEPYTWSQAKLASLPGYAPTGPAKDKEYAEAKKLLAEAGYPDGLEITVECESLEPCEVFQQQMQRIGVKLLKVNFAGNSVESQVYMKDKQLASHNQGGGHVPDYSLVSFFLCDSAKNMSQICDPKLEAWHKDFRRTYDEKQQVEILAKVQYYLWELMPIAATQRNANYHISFKWVRGWRNPMYDTASDAHGDQTAYTWLDK